jgi:hypothetical protein
MMPQCEKCGSYAIEDGTCMTCKLREEEHGPIVPMRPRIHSEENFRHGQDTEERGAETGAKSAQSVRLRIFELLKKRPMTDDELEVEWESNFGVPTRRFFGNTLRRRRHELKKAGFVVDTGQRRASRCGVPNIVWSVK